MKTIIFSLFFGCCLLHGAPARATDFVFSSFQCDPISCQETGPLATISSAFVSVDSTCTGGVVPGFNKTVLANVGTPGECMIPYQPFALVEKITSTLLDDCGDPYDVDTMRTSAEVFDSPGHVVFSLQAEFSCDGGEGSPTQFGSKPC